MFRLSLILGISAVLVGPIKLSAQNFNPEGFLDTQGGDVGVTVFSFLKLPTSARSIGLGGPTLTTNEEASVVQDNPAGLALVQNYYYSLSHGEILGEFRHENLAFTYPTESHGTFGGAANILAATAFEDARDIDENPSKPSAYDIALGLAYGKSLLAEQFAVGARVDLIRSSIDGAIAYGYGLNAGLLFMLVYDIRLAILVKNMSHGVRYRTRTGPIEALPTSLGLEIGKPLLDDRWSLHGGIRQTNEGVMQYYAGTEWRIMNYLILRLGFENSTQDRELGSWTGLATGLGIKYDQLVLDYGFKGLGPIGSYHALTLNYSRKSKFRPRDEVLMEAAEGKYRKGKYRPALRLARAAIAINPYNLKAQALAQKIQLELDRDNGSAIDIFYTANTDGQITSNWKEGRPIGGLARRKTKLLELKGAHSTALFLDAGNLTNPKSNLGQDKYIYGAYAQMPYDAINIGSAEVIQGKTKWDKRLPLLASQRPLSEMKGYILPTKVMKLKLGGEVRVIGGLDQPNLVGEDLDGLNFEKIHSAVRRQSGDASEQRILILLLNSNLKEALLLAKKNPQLDAIILSNEPQVLGIPMKVGKTLVCSPGRGGSHIGELTFLLDKQGEIKSFRHFLIPLDASIAQDPELAEFLAPITIDPNKFSLDGYDDDYRAQVMAFIQKPLTPENLGRLFIRDLVKGRDYWIPTGNISPSHPLLGYGKNKIALMGEDSAKVKEVFAFELGIERLDTLTKMGGRAIDMQWTLGNNALLTTYAKDGKTELFRIDPWSREVRNLSKGRFGQVQGFGVTKIGDRIALNASDGKISTLWVTNGQLESPLAVTADQRLIGSPRWSPQGDKLAFLAASKYDTSANTNYSDSIIGELRVFDFTAKKMLSATEESHVRSFSWSADGKRVYYAAGINLHDINAFNLDSMTLGKVTNPVPIPRNESNPMAKVYRGKDGILFETTVHGQRNIHWMDRATLEEKVFVDSVGENSLK